MENKEPVVSGGIEFLKNIGIKEVSNRTFIHEDELKKFLDGNFAGINKTKAMGFIQILEREFNIKLDDLKSKYISYLNEIQPEEEEQPKQSLMMEEVQSEERKKGLFSFLFLVAAIGSIAYLINKYDLLNFSSPSDIKTAEILNDDDVKNAKLNLEKLTEPEKPKIVKNIVKEESIIASEIENKSDDLNLSEVLSKSEKNKTETETKVEKNQELDLSKLNQELSENTETNKNTITNTEKIVLQDQNNTSTDAVTNEIYIVPNSKVWIGTIDLDTLKKKDFLAPKGKRVDIDTSTNKLIMIGHKFVNMYLNGEKVRFKKKGPIRFKYIDGVLTEINRGEFNKLAKGKQW